MAAHDALPVVAELRGGLDLLTEGAVKVVGQLQVLRGDLTLAGGPSAPRLQSHYRDPVVQHNLPHYPRTLTILKSLKIRNRFPVGWIQRMKTLNRPSARTRRICRQCRQWRLPCLGRRWRLRRGRASVLRCESARRRTPRGKDTPLWTGDLPERCWDLRCAAW